jgi:hypothetical protein
VDEDSSYHGHTLSYEGEIQFHCGHRLPLINISVYDANEGFFGSLASNHTEEYFLSPSTVFYEFIKEEDIHQVGCFSNNVAALNYIMNLLHNWTFLLCCYLLESAEIPCIPLTTVASRVESLLVVSGEKTTDDHLMHVLNEGALQRKKQGMNIVIYLTAYLFPPRHSIFLEFIRGQNYEQGVLA